MNSLDIRDHLFSKIDDKAAALYPEEKEKKLQKNYSKHLARTVSIYGKQNGFTNKVVNILIRAFNGLRALFGISDWQLARKQITKASSGQLDFITNKLDAIAEKRIPIISASIKNYNKFIEKEGKSLLKKIGNGQLEILRKATYLEANDKAELDNKINELARQVLSSVYDSIIARTTKALGSQYPQLQGLINAAFKSISDGDAKNAFIQMNTPI